MVGGAGGRRVGRYCSMEAEFQFCKMKGLEMDGEDGGTMM